MKLQEEVASELKSVPYNLEIEEDILGAILQDPQCMDVACELIRPEFFYLRSHRLLFGAALALTEAHRPCNYLEVKLFLEDHSLLSDIGGEAKLARLNQRSSPAYELPRKAELLRDRYLRRCLIRVAHEVADDCNDSSINIEDLFDAAERSIFGLTQLKQKNQGLVSAAEIVTEAFSGIELRSKGGSSGITCGFYDLDQYTQGFQRSDLIIVAGRPSMGKTAMSLAIARNIAAIHNLPVAIFSLEMSKEQLIHRLIANETKLENGAGIDSSRLRAGKIGRDEWEPLGKSVAALAHLRIFVDDTPEIRVAEIRSKARRLKAEQGELGAIVIDYLQLISGTQDEKSRVQELSRITRSLKGLARELNVPVFALSQLSRNVEYRNNKRPIMSDLRDSGSIEQDSDLIMMLYRHDYYFPESPDKGVAEIIITKHRNGPVGTVKLLFEPQFNRFKTIAPRF